MNRKKAITILATIAMLTTLLAPLMLMSNVQATPDPASWYRTENGVLTTDEYALYPYFNNSTDIGFSKYGEMISYNEATGIGVGIQYPGYEEVGTYDQTEHTSRDPFANEGILEKYWLNGWLLEARYTHRTLRDRRILAFALFGDMSGFGGDWIVGKELPLATAPYGGRKTTAYAETDDLTILYDGPRRLVALAVNHIYDWADMNEDEVVDHPTETWPVLDVMLTYIFNKVKKEVIVLKDIKLIIETKILDSPVDVQFSNRGEWDMGPGPDWDSYVHFYNQTLYTCYGPEWHMAPGILREYKHSETGPSGPANEAWLPSAEYPYCYPVVERSERVYVNDVFQEPGIDYHFDYDTGVITFTYDLESDDDWDVYYKLPKCTTYSTGNGEEWLGIEHNYDLAQLIGSNLDYVGWAAFWPTLSDYTVDGWGRVFNPLLNVNEKDMVPGGSEPDIPFVVGEWDFMLDYTEPFAPMFRGVTVYGLTDRHDADDWDNPDGSGNNIIDREAMFQLNEVFDPWDLVDSVEKYTSRYVEFVNITEVDETFETNSTNIPVIVRPDNGTNYISINAMANEWMPDPIEWDQYCVFSERIINLNTSKLLLRNVDYDIVYVPANETALITFYEEGNMKILYSADDYWTWPRYEWITVGREAHTVDSIGASLVSAAFKNKGIEIGFAAMDMIYEEYGIQSVPNMMRKFGTGDANTDYRFDYAGGDHRTALRDDWCGNWSVASSNTIGVGGAGANVYNWYLNDFTEGFYGLPLFTSYDPWTGAVVALSCWNKTGYYSSSDTGYAVIGTYKDINGTVFFTVWGVWGRDTFYATQWLHGDQERDMDPGIWDLQCMNEHVTSIILEIDYEDPEHPTFDIVEYLGTISEKPQHDCP
jgi:hypothetical protein